MTTTEILQLEMDGIIGTGIPASERNPVNASDQQIRIDRKELTRIESSLATKRFDESNKVDTDG